MNFRRLLLPILLLVIWSTVASVPSLRRLWHAQAAGVGWPLQLTRSAYTAPLAWMVHLFHPSLESQELAERYPNHLGAQIVAIEASSGDPVARLQRYDQLIQRFPAVPWLVAHRLRLGVSALGLKRVAGEIDNPVVVPTPTAKPRPVPAPTAFPTATPLASPLPVFKADAGNGILTQGVAPPGAPPGAPPTGNRSIRSLPKDADIGTTMEPRELARHIAAARRGRELEPENSYYDWILASFLFASHRDREALDVLKEGARKRVYNAHLGEETQARIAAYELNQPALLLDKFTIIAGQLYPHLITQRQAARLTVWYGVLAQRRGDHRRAIELYNVVMRLGRLMRQGAYSRIEVMVATDLQKMAWHGVDVANRRVRPGKPRLESQRFARYASRHGRSDLARAAHAEVEAIRRLQRQMTRHIDFHATFPGVSNDEFTVLALLLSLSADLLYQLPLLIFLWVLLSAPVGAFYAMHTLKHAAWKQSSGARVNVPHDSLVERRDVRATVVRWALLTVLLVAAQLVLVGWSIIKADGLFTVSGFMEAAFANVVGVGDVPGADADILTARLLSHFVPTLFTLLFCMAIATRQQPSVSKFQGWWPLLKALAAGAPFNPNVTFDFEPAIRFLLRSTVSVLFFGAGISVLMSSGWTRAQVAALFIFVALFGHYFMSWLPQPRKALAYASHCLRRALSIVLALVSLLYLLVAGLFVGPHAEAEARVQSMIEHGEIQFAVLRDTFENR